MTGKEKLFNAYTSKYIDSVKRDEIAEKIVLLFDKNDTKEFIDKTFERVQKMLNKVLVVKY